jgi:hypothetical protein
LLFLGRRNDGSIVKLQAGPAAIVPGEKNRAIVTSRQTRPSASQPAEIECRERFFQKEKLRFEGVFIRSAFEVARYGGFVQSPDFRFDAVAGQVELYLHG